MDSKYKSEIDKIKECFGDEKEDYRTEIERVKKYFLGKEVGDHGTKYDLEELKRIYSGTDQKKQIEAFRRGDVLKDTKLPRSVKIGIATVMNSQPLRNYIEFADDVCDLSSRVKINSVIYALYNTIFHNNLQLLYIKLADYCEYILLLKGLPPQIEGNLLSFALGVVSDKKYINMTEVEYKSEEFIKKFITLGTTRLKKQHPKEITVTNKYPFALFNIKDDEKILKGDMEHIKRTAININTGILGFCRVIANLDLWTLLDGATQENIYKMIVEVVNVEEKYKKTLGELEAVLKSLEKEGIKLQEVEKLVESIRNSIDRYSESVDKKSLNIQKLDRKKYNL